jgi:hypothetical protein
MLVSLLEAHTGYGDLVMSSEPVSPLSKGERDVDFSDDDEEDS